MEDRIIDIIIILLFIGVIVLKLTGVITCSWLTLFTPILILLGIGLILAILAVIFILKGVK